ncbi:MAG: hypothetical protein KF708_10510 [Pirellulales bacterium]|nr:hypothetical protein [Pirellulales bacterium]
MALRHLLMCNGWRRRAVPLAAVLGIAWGSLQANVACLAQAPAAPPAAAPAAAPAPAAPAPRFKEQSEFKEPTGSKIGMIKVLAEGQITDPKMFDDWCRFRVAEFTLGKNAALLPEMRKKLKQDMQRAKDPARTQAVNRFLAHTREIIADGAYSPTARVNAILILGDLNKTEPNFQGSGTVPLPEAQVELLKLIDNAGPVDDLSDALRAAALIGLQRHAAGPMSEDVKKKLSDELRALAQAQTPPAGRSPDVHDWLSGRAKGILEALGAGASATSP